MADLDKFYYVRLSTLFDVLPHARIQEFFQGGGGGGGASRPKGQKTVWTTCFFVVVF